VSNFRRFFNRFLGPARGSLSVPAFADPQSDEPFFMTARDSDPEMDRAHRLARETLSDFYGHCSRPGSHICAAKIRLPDPIRSKSTGKPRFFFLWITPVTYDADSDQLSGDVFWIPSRLDEIYPVGLTVSWRPSETYDWYVNDDGHFTGGFSLRVVRSRLSDSDQRAFDSRVGVTSWTPSVALL
jgi:hypothetical protein